MSNQPVPDNTALSIPQEEYLKLEAGKLNSEVEKLMEEIRSREKYSITIIAGVAVWFFSNMNDFGAAHGKGLLVIISSIPMVTTLIYGISVKFLYDNIQWIGEYLSKVENHFYAGKVNDKNEPWGWEWYFDQKNKKGKFIDVTWVIWICQILFSIALIIVAVFST